METIQANRLPLITYRYLKSNDSPLLFKAPSRLAEVVFSDTAYVRAGGIWPSDYNGTAPEVTSASGQGKTYTIEIPGETEANLVISINTDTDVPDFAGRFIFKLHKNSRLHLVWNSHGGKEEATVVISSFYELGENSCLTVSSLEKGFEKTSFYEERNILAGKEAKAQFVAAKMVGEKSILHSYGKLSGDKSEINEGTVYAAGGTQHLDLFYHIDHVGKETKAQIDVKGSLSERSSKTFRGTLDFKRGCSGSVGDEGDYAIQLSPTTRNVSLPLLLCTEDNVIGNHASSSGQLDNQVIYFLMTRGFSLEEARRIVVESLIRPLVDRMDESLQEDVLAIVRKKLEAEEA